MGDNYGRKLHAHFEQQEDETVVDLVHKGDIDALEYLIHKYKNFVRAKARSYFLIGADREDIVQEGMIGLYKAIRDFREDKLTSFKAFAELCITRQIITAIKTATRQKHIPLNSYVSLDKPIYDEERQKKLESLGVRFLRFHDSDIRFRIDDVLRTIEDWIKEHSLE